MQATVGCDIARHYPPWRLIATFFRRHALFAGAARSTRCLRRALHNDVAALSGAEALVLLEG
jgi:hypothetical protein